MRTVNFCRFRPVIDADGIDRSDIQVQSPVSKQKNSPQFNNASTFQFDHTFQPKSTQSDIFHMISQTILQNLDQNSNISIVTVGPPLSGKTFTLIGSKSTSENKFEEGIFFMLVKHFLSLFVLFKQSFASLQ